ncbi:MAG: nucleotidyltransferase family protein [Verrucomicrobiaceae bacterium]|nr:nucleotidyltransferase family protein [Verrucomicrobiaceae bacterium]
MRALYAVQSLNLPDWLIGAGFVRNLIWGSVFNKNIDINDIDVIYFCRDDVSKERDIFLEKRLRELEPNFSWSVKNQARMHLKHGDAPYDSTLDAMRFWPEKQTSIGVCLNNNGAILVQHCFDLSLQFSGNINRNPARSVEIFEDRVSSKGWLNIWPSLQVVI